MIPLTGCHWRSN